MGTGAGVPVSPAVAAMRLGRFPMGAMLIAVFCGSPQASPKEEPRRHHLDRDDQAYDGNDLDFASPPSASFGSGMSRFGGFSGSRCFRFFRGFCGHLAFPEEDWPPRKTPAKSPRAIDASPSSRN